MRGKTVVITGAFGILGRAAAEEAKARGATVAMLDIRVSEQGYTDPALAIGVDLGDFAATSAAMTAIREKTGRIDALLNIAGGFVWQTVEEGDIAAWERMFGLNTKTALIASKAALP